MGSDTTLSRRNLLTSIFNARKSHEVLKDKTEKKVEAPESRSDELVTAGQRDRREFLHDVGKTTLALYLAGNAFEVPGLVSVAHADDTKKPAKKADPEEVKDLLDKLEKKLKTAKMDADKGPIYREYLNLQSIKRNQDLSSLSKSLRARLDKHITFTTSGDGTLNIVASYISYLILFVTSIILEKYASSISSIFSSGNFLALASFTFSVHRSGI